MVWNVPGRKLHRPNHCPSHGALRMISSNPGSPILHEISDGFQAKRIIDNWIGLYSSERPHTPLDKRTPDTAYFTHAEERCSMHISQMHITRAAKLT
jgi:hypothetical protein